MAPLSTECCENCRKHDRKKRHPYGGECDTCLPLHETLHRCNSCKTIRYCTRECQKSHWKAHRAACQSNVDIRITSELLGVVVSERQKAFKKWCESHVNPIALAGISALDLRRDFSRTADYVFVVYLDVVQGRSPKAPHKLTFSHSVKTAICTPIAEVHRIVDPKFPMGGYDAVERDLGGPGVLRVLVFDEGLPSPLDVYTVPTVVEGVLHTPFQANWLASFKRAVNPSH